MEPDPFPPMTYFFVISAFAVVEVDEAGLVDEVVGRLLVVDGRVLAVVEVAKAVLVAGVVVSALVVDGMVLAVVEVAKAVLVDGVVDTELVDGVVDTVLVVVTLTSFTVPSAFTATVFSLEKPLSLL